MQEVQKNRWSGGFYPHISGGCHIHNIHPVFVTKTNKEDEGIADTVTTAKILVLWVSIEEVRALLVPDVQMEQTERDHLFLQCQEGKMGHWLTAMKRVWWWGHPRLQIIISTGQILVLVGSSWEVSCNDHTQSPNMTTPPHRQANSYGNVDSPASQRSVIKLVDPVRGHWLWEREL